jgi:hypothetical protein
VNAVMQIEQIDGVVAKKSHCRPGTCVLDGVRSRDFTKMTSFANASTSVALLPIAKGIAAVAVQKEATTFAPPQAMSARRQGCPWACI